MRGMFLVSRQSHMLIVASSVEDGLQQLQREASPRTPAPRMLLSTLRAMAHELGCEDALQLTPDERRA